LNQANNLTPISLKQPKVVDWHPIILKINNKMAQWRSSRDGGVDNVNIIKSTNLSRIMSLGTHWHHLIDLKINKEIYLEKRENE